MFSARSLVASNWQRLNKQVNFNYGKHSSLKEYSYVYLDLPKVRFFSDFIAIVEAFRMMMSGGKTNKQEDVSTNGVNCKPTDSCPL